jgi:hypothetical protein
MSYKEEPKNTVDGTHYLNEPVDEEVGVTKRGDALRKDLQSRHMQMIAIGTGRPCLPLHRNPFTNLSVSNMNMVT